MESVSFKQREFEFEEPMAILRKGGLQTKYVYWIKVREAQAENPYLIERRYNQFEYLWNRLIADTDTKFLAIPALPPADLVNIDYEERLRKLENFLNLINSMPELNSNTEYTIFL